MPNRILRDWTDSETIDKLSIQDERFFLRLIMKADDYGRYSANLKILKSTLFPLKTDVRETDIALWLTECEQCGVIALYHVASKEFLQIENFKQILRQKKEKYPPPEKMLGTCVADDKQMPSNGIPEEKRRETNRNRIENEESEKGNRARANGLKKNSLSEASPYRQPVIPGKAEVLRVFQEHGGTKEMAKKFFDRNESTGWFSRGSPITNFANLVPSFVENWNKNLESKRGNHKHESSAPPLKNSANVN